MYQKRSLLLVGLFLGFVSVFFPARSAQARFELIPSDTRPLRGEVVRLRVPGDSVCEASAEFRGNPLFFYEGSNQKQALLGIPLEGDTGPTSLKFTLRACGGELIKKGSLELLVREGDYPVQHLSIEDPSKVQLSDTDLNRYYRESRSIRRALSQNTPRRKWWSFPFRFPLAQRQTGDSFGSRRVINGRPRSPHSGEDYQASRGETVLAVNGGEVSLVGNFFFSGKSIFIDHGAGLHSMYFHLSSINVSEGQRVQKGEAIGEVGTTGRVTGPHLHLGIRLNGARVDPEWFFSPGL